MSAHNNKLKLAQTGYNHHICYNPMRDYISNGILSEAFITTDVFVFD